MEMDGGITVIIITITEVVVVATVKKQWKTPGKMMHLRGIVYKSQTCYKLS
jgi:hypothetical protein